MSDQQVMAAMTRAGKRAGYHLLKALVESLKAIEAVIEEIGSIGEDVSSGSPKNKERIEIE